MHAYLVVGANTQIAFSKAKELASSLGKVSYEFSITKIGQVRELSKFLALSFSAPTSFIIKDLQDATDEAMNAFLKNLEDPQRYVRFVLISSSEYKLIPTIISRCQVIRIKNQESATMNFDKNVQAFLDMSVGEKFRYLDSLKKREDALNFIKELITLWHSKLIKAGKDASSIPRQINLAQDTYRSLNSNGNVLLQLTNFTIVCFF